MNQRLRQRSVKDERDIQIDTRSRSAALEFVIAATQILTLMCLVKGNPAWKGSLALLFIGGSVVVLAIVLDRLTQGWFGSGKEQDTPDADGEN